MKNFKELDVKNFEAELGSIIKEVEEYKEKQELLIQENNQLRTENIKIKANEARYKLTLEENIRLKEELDKKNEVNLSEKDLADVMLNAKRVANEIIRKSHEEEQKFKEKKQDLIKQIKHEGENIKQEVINFKNKIDEDFSVWLEELKKLIEGQVEY